jgi:hypothetical protein
LSRPLIIHVRSATAGGSSAPDPKFARTLPHLRPRTSGPKRGTSMNIFLVSLMIPKFA